jgi:endonuclease/exonuclease/phosphatase family metal-dependent hydrolase
MKPGFSRFINLFSVIVALFFALAATAEAGPNARKAKIKVVSYNLYLGASIFRVFDPPACGAAQAVYDIHSIIQQTDFPARAEAIADQIAMQEPHVVALQEVTLLRTGPADSLTPSGIEWLDEDSCTSPPCFTFKTNAEDVSFDYLQILQDALASRGLYFKVAHDASPDNADVEFPAINFSFDGVSCAPASVPIDVRLTDRDVVLVREDLEINDQASGNFQINLPIELPTVLATPGGPLHATYVAEFTRSWGSVNLTVKDNDFSILNTHLEVGDSLAPPDHPLNLIQGAQALEAFDVFSLLPIPALFVGDINSSPDSGLTDPRPAYSILTGLGQLEDLWNMRHQPKSEAGFTCCQNEYVDNPVSALNERIDVILADFGDLDVDKAKFELLGDQPADMTPSGLWPSDHAGVAVKLEFER